MKLRVLLTSMLLALFVVVPTATAHAEPEVSDLKVVATLDADGNLRVENTLTGADLGDRVEQRITKRLPQGDLRTFHYEVDDVEVTADGASVDADIVDDEERVTVSFDAGELGEVPVTIAYTVRGTTSEQEGDDEVLFRWPVVQGLNIPVDTVNGQVQMRATPPDFSCQAGNPANTHNCALWNIDQHTPELTTFVDGPLAPREIVDVSGSQPADAVAVTADVHERWTLDRAFSLNLGTALASLAVLALGGLALWMWHRKVGRDAVASSEPTVIGEFHPIGDGVSEFRLAADVRPGQVGTVADESVDPVDVTGTILDLAVRGHLVIEQLDIPGSIDWAFHRQERSTDDLHQYERTLLDAVAPVDGPIVMVSNLQEAVGPVVPQLQHELYDDVVAQGWFDKHPEAARTDSRTVGAALLVVGLVVTALLAWLTTWGLVGAAIVAIGVAALFIAGEMPRRSPKGAALLAGLHGFSAILSQQSVEVLPKGRELDEISKVLPYAIVLGGKDRWIQAMVAADEDDTPDPDAIGWFKAPQDWHLQQLPQSLDALVASIQGHLFGR